MNKNRIKIQNLNIPNAELSNLNEDTAQVISGGGATTGFEFTVTVNSGVATCGFATNPNQRSLTHQQSAFEISPFGSNFFTPKI
jgi:hypothetical protein